MLWPVLLEDRRGEIKRGITGSPIALRPVDSAIPTPAATLPRDGVEIPVKPGAKIIAPYAGSFSIGTLSTSYFASSGSVVIRSYFDGVAFIRDEKKAEDGQLAEEGGQIGVATGDKVTWWLFGELSEEWIDPVKFGRDRGAVFLSKPAPQDTKSGFILGVLAVAGILWLVRK